MARSTRALVDPVDVDRRRSSVLPLDRPRSATVPVKTTSARHRAAARRVRSGTTGQAARGRQRAAERRPARGAREAARAAAGSAGHGAPSQQITGRRHQPAPAPRRRRRGRARRGRPPRRTRRVRVGHGVRRAGPGQHRQVVGHVAEGDHVGRRRPPARRRPAASVDALVTPAALISSSARSSDQVITSRSPTTASAQRPRTPPGRAPRAGRAA